MQSPSDSTGSAHSNTIAALLRVTATYDELPGLSVTLPQAQRLWWLDEVVCEGILTALIDVGFLDPLDALVFWDVASFPGVVITCRALGVLRVEQNHMGGDRLTRVRNDRVLAVPIGSRREEELTTVDALPRRVREEIANFVVAVTALVEKDVTVPGWDGPADALALVTTSAPGGERL